MTNHKFYLFARSHKITGRYTSEQVHTAVQKYFGLKYRVTVAELRIVIPFLLGYKYTLFLVIYVHGRKHE